MKDGYIIYKCRTCNKGFILFTNEVKHTEEESRFITCPHHGRHKDIIVVSSYGSIKECMEQQYIYKKVKGRIRQTK